MKEKWDARYSEGDFAYGKEPNVFFKEWLPKLEAGTILMPADGEGRNGVFAAMQGWKVTSLDLSAEGKTKALKLAKEQGVELNYLVGDLAALNFDKVSFDAIGLIYAHFGAENKSALHKKLDQYLKVGGYVIFEAFSKKHLELRKQNPKVGGPNNIDTLFSEEEVRNDFKNYEVLLLEEQEIELNEGKYHIGKGSVIRFVGRKLSENLSS
ncbi:class I SAM-dependent methyltransferase [uncultured Arcticibacterium sp.]|uniref:class I SAM-dependent methyltransferase n=1 Tax=uncultured Arcticibacterium sp. TaxID=2173042 RepID=UPI0030F97B0E